MSAAESKWQPRGTHAANARIAAQERMNLADNQRALLQTSMNIAANNKNGTSGFNYSPSEPVNTGYQSGTADTADTADTVGATQSVASNTGLGNSSNIIQPYGINSTPSYMKNYGLGFNNTNGMA